MYYFKINPKTRNFKNRFEAHLERCKLYYENGGMLHNNVDYFFKKEGIYSSFKPNLNIDFNIKHGVNYQMIKDFTKKEKK